MVIDEDVRGGISTAEVMNGITILDRTERVKRVENLVMEVREVALINLTLLVQEQDQK